LDDLTPSEHIALKEHLAMCGVCKETHMAYQTMKTSFRSLLANETTPQISLHSPQKTNSSISNLEFILPDIFTFFSTMLATLYFGFYLSKIYLKFHYWLLFIPSLFSRKISYATTGSHNLYAIRSDSGFMMWSQNRYQKYNTLYTIPVRMIGINCFSSGTALLSAMDFCKYTARA
jgi:hypothetical protein